MQLHTSCTERMGLVFTTGTSTSVPALEQRLTSKFNRSCYTHLVSRGQQPFHLLQDAHLWHI